MRHLRVAVASAMLVAILGILATPWVQVVEENTRTETFTYPTTYTYSYTYVSTVTGVSTTGYTTILDLNNVHARGTSYESKKFQLGWNQILKIEFRLRSPMFCPPEKKTLCFVLLLCRVWNYPYEYDTWYEEVVHIFPKDGGFQISDWRRYYDPENFVTPLPKGCSLEQACTDPLGHTQPPDEPWWYVIAAFNFGNDPVRFDLKIAAPQITKTTSVTTSTSLEQRTSTVTSMTTLTWHNTTYRRPIG